MKWCWQRCNNSRLKIITFGKHCKNFKMLLLWTLSCESQPYINRNECPSVPSPVLHPWYLQHLSSIQQSLSILMFLSLRLVYHTNSVAWQLDSIIEVLSIRFNLLYDENPNSHFNYFRQVGLIGTISRVQLKPGSLDSSWNTITSSRKHWSCGVLINVRGDGSSTRLLT